MRFLKFFRAESQKSELDEEIAAHLTMAATDKRDRGASSEAARQEAQREFGNTALIKDVTHESSSRGWLWLERLQQDLKYALRQIRKSPGFAASVIGTLALGIAAATAMFTVVDHALLRSLPYPHASRLVQIYEGPDSHSAQYVSLYPDIASWREQARSFQSVAFYSDSNGRSFLEGKTATTQVQLTLVSGNLFQTLGVAPQLGSGLKNLADTFAATGETHTLALSDVAWRTLFDADPNIVGKTVQINGEPYNVVGVMPHGFFFPSTSHARSDSESPQVWAPVALGEKDKQRTEDSPSGYKVIARLSDGVKLAQASGEMQIIQARVAQGYTDPEWRSSHTHVRLERYGSSDIAETTSHALLALTGAAGLLWLIACMNATNLLLARASARQQEIAMRGALGASRCRLMQQLIVEGLVLSSISALLGIVFAIGAISIFHRALQHNLPFSIPSAPNLTVLMALATLTVISAIISSLWPAFLSARSPIESALKQGGQRSGVSRSQHRLRGSLVIAEIAMSLALLSACGLLLRTIYALRHAPLGFRTDHIIVANMQIPTYRFAAVNASQLIYEPLLERVSHLPGIDAAGLMTEVPLGQTFKLHLQLSDKNSSKKVTLLFKAVSPEIQQVFAFPMLRGRYFNAQDTASSEPVIVVNRAFAHAYRPQEQNPGKVIGMQLMTLARQGQQNGRATVIGVLDDFHQSSVGQPAMPEVQVCLPQITPDSGFYTALEGIAMDLAVRTQRPLAQVIPELREALRQASPELANSNITTMDQIVEDSYGSQMLAAHLLEIFAASALLLCIAGLYGLLVYVVSQRTREMGVRFALGAQRGDVIWLVMRQAGLLVITGVVLGLALAFASTRFIRSYLYGVSAHDTWTLTAVAVLLLLSGAVAAYLPARRAAQVNPVEALRAE
jgi:predicted permease